MQSAMKQDTIKKATINRGMQCRSEARKGGAGAPGDGGGVVVAMGSRRLCTQSVRACEDRVIGSSSPGPSPSSMSRWAQLAQALSSRMEPAKVPV